MSGHRSFLVGGVRLFLLAALVAGCGDKAPTRYPRDPLVGKWTGEFSRLNGTMSNPGEFEIVVQAGGETVATGISRYWHTTGHTQEMIFIRLLVGAGGLAVGQGTLLALSDKHYLWAEGVAFAEFDGDSGQGGGSFEIDFGEGLYVMSWTVTKEGVR